jgi:thioredoxin 1
MLTKNIFVVTVLALLSTLSTAFTGSSRAFCARQHVATPTQLQAVIDIGSEAAFDKTIKGSGDSLVIVDYSTTWCGPCKGA